MATEPGPFDADPAMNEILDAAEKVDTPEGYQAADEMINNIGETPKEK